MDYKKYYDLLKTRINEVLENEDRLSVPELIETLSTTIESVDSNCFIDEINDVFSYYVERVKDGSSKVGAYFIFDSAVNFIVQFRYYDEVVKFLNQHLDKIDYIMKYLKATLGVE